MVALKSIVKIGAYEFEGVNNIKIKKSVDLVSNTATIKMPISALLENQNKGFERKNLESAINAGDAVSITLAYEGVYEKEEFVGFVAFIKPNSPILELQCEDGVYNIRKKRINKNFGATNLRAVLKFIVEGTGVELSGNLPDVKFDKFLLKNVNGAAALDKLKDEYGLNIFLDDEGKLFAGLRQTVGTGLKVDYNLHKNIIKHKLTYRNIEDIRLRIKVIGIQKDNTKVEVIVGDLDGEQRTLFKYNIKDKARLTAIGEAELSDLKYTGYDGAITSFLIPYANCGMTAVIEDDFFPERTGNYFIVTVTTTFGVNGARRIVELGTQV